MSVWTVVVAAVGVMSIGVITLLGAIASTAVAIAAFRSSALANQIANSTRADALEAERRRGRREFYDAALTWLAGAKLDILGHHSPDFPTDPYRVADLIDSDSAHDIVWWLDAAQREVIGAGAIGSNECKNAYQSVVELFGRFGAAWVRTGIFEREMYTAPIS